MAVVLPIPEDPSSITTTTLNQTRYNFLYQYSSRGNCWYVDVYTDSGVYLAKRSKLVLNRPILTMNRDQGPDGQIYVTSTSDIATETPVRDNIGIGKEYQIVYFSRQELESVIS